MKFFTAQVGERLEGSTRLFYRRTGVCVRGINRPFIVCGPVIILF